MQTSASKQLCAPELYKDSYPHGAINVALGAPSPWSRLLFVDVDQPRNVLEIPGQLDGQLRVIVGQRGEPDDFKALRQAPKTM